MANLSNTQYFKVKTEPEVQVKEVLDVVYTAMEEKGYNPVNQIVGYIMSGDPTYITSYKGARSMIMKVERDELVEELLKEYIKNRSWESRSKRPPWFYCPGCGNHPQKIRKQDAPDAGKN